MKPLLASAVTEFGKLRFPMLASPKLDGIRCLITREGPMTRSLKKPIPNDFIRECLAHLPVGFDGEIITYTDGKMDELNTVQGNVMRKDGTCCFTFHVFDDFSAPSVPYEDRYPRVCDDPSVSIVPVKLITNNEMLIEYEEEQLALGYEGVMLRTLRGPYKYGRSTENEQILLKVKRFFDDEATVVGKIERMHNTNEAKTNALGRTERSSAKAGLVPMGTLGALECVWNGDIRFEIGTGFSDAQRAELWAADLDGKLVTFKYQRPGPNGAPLLPVFKALRDECDT